MTFDYEVEDDGDLPDTLSEYPLSSLSNDSSWMRKITEAAVVLHDTIEILQQQEHFGPLFDDPEITYKSLPDCQNPVRYQEVMISLEEWTREASQDEHAVSGNGFLKDLELLASEDPTERQNARVQRREFQIQLMEYGTALQEVWQRARVKYMWPRDISDIFEAMRDLSRAISSAVDKRHFTGCHKVEIDDVMRSDEDVTDIATAIRQCWCAWKDLEDATFESNWDKLNSTWTDTNI
ncbi:hypothetical protein TREMEDRAFT_61515 [Tremella mesenterica DSM 1558]|uniref:uncharacterized protein n=1 Tax=Tremella mesenterica (strain ATCC 24925 / CBS 8224 / DSM 1558 / NBRC 9311 / NRRL Y-6157 / RJB 2259-6 / UBC 559-6) TaxID=578456 RepID=UPI0003F48FBC|nr:uncharacterized protein TREMEDRAFT_61515 [Tremella mesenterica DSM 1558]EIW69751.1 hypothetical protein TREMEDRAFT_61515 [Tremella mesenterica DSM 1558]